MPHWSHIGDTIPPSLPVQERGTGAVLRRCVVPLDCPCARGCVGIASRVPAANPRRRALRQKRAHVGRTPSDWPYDQVVTECLILRPRAMQVINCAAWHGQQRRQAVARRDSMAASTPNSHENKVKNAQKRKNINRRLRRAGGPHLPPAWVPPRALASPQSLTYYAYVLRIRTPKVSERAYAPRTTHTHSGFE